MKYSLKKSISRALLPLMFSYTLGVNPTKAGQDALQDSNQTIVEEINPENSELLFSYSQTPSIKILKKKLEGGKDYTIEGFHFRKPSQCIDYVRGYIKNDERYLDSPEGRLYLNDSLTKLNDLEDRLVEMLPIGIENFKKAAIGGIITAREYRQLQSGDICAIKKVYGDSKRGRIDEILMLEMPYDNVLGKYVGDIKEEDIDLEKEKIVVEHRINLDDPILKRLIKDDKKEEKNWCARQKFWCGVAIAAAVGAVAAAVSGGGDGGDDGGPEPRPVIDIGGGDEF